MNEVGPETDFLAKALAIAVQAHTGQRDKSGQPYLLHPLRMAMRVESENERLVAILHDVVEDGGISLEEIESAGFNSEVLRALSCISRTKGEPYERFIDRVATNRLATKVKIEDLRDNLNLARLATITEHDLERVLKYHQALSRLLEKQNEP